MNIEFSSSLTDIVEKNQSFDIGKLRIAYTGRNRNNTFIKKEAFERAIPTMFNCPLVANYIRKNNEIGSHDGEFIKNKDGETKYVNITQPVGLVPESAQWYWENLDDNGVLHQYLCTEVVLWKRQEAYDKLKESGVTKQSMEIEVTDGEMLDDYYEIKDFCFTAFCLLGTAEPCFESAALFTFAEQEDFKRQYTEMLKEFKLAFACVSDNSKKKEENKELKLKELLEKYSVAEKDLTFETDGLSEKELEAKFTEQFDTSPSDGSFVLNSQIRETLYDAVRSIDTIEADWGSYPRYWMVDYDESLNEVYFYDENDYKLYGCSYSHDNDDIKLDTSTIKRKKYVITDYAEGDGEQTFNLFELIGVFNDKYAEVKADADELERLRAFEHDVLTAKRESAEKSLFKKFEEKLKENPEFEALKKNASKYELDDLEKELFALVGKVDFTLSLKNMGENNNDGKPKPMFGFEAFFSSNEPSDDERMDSFMKEQLSK